MKKVSIVLTAFFLILVSVMTIVLAIMSEPLPVGEKGAHVEMLTDKMLAALNAEAYENLEMIKWSFPRGHHFVWNREQDSVEVRWSDYRVTFKTKTLDGVAYENGQQLSGAAKSDALQDAWSLFANDSFWLVAPFKVRDPGTSRSYVATDRGSGILVTYSSGGVTPGDSYLWVLDENYRPKYWKLWTQILPVGGIEFEWNGWERHAGAWFAPQHKGPGSLSIDLTNLEVMPK